MHAIDRAAEKGGDGAIAEFVLAAATMSPYRGSASDVLPRRLCAARRAGADVLVRTTCDGPLIDREIAGTMVAARFAAWAGFNATAFRCASLTAWLRRFHEGNVAAGGRCRRPTMRAGACDAMDSRKLVDRAYQDRLRAPASVGGADGVVLSGRFRLSTLRAVFNPVCFQFAGAMNDVIAALGSASGPRRLDFRRGMCRAWT